PAIRESLRSRICRRASASPEVIAEREERSDVDAPCRSVLAVRPLRSPGALRCGVAVRLSVAYLTRGRSAATVQGRTYEKSPAPAGPATFHVRQGFGLAASPLDPEERRLLRPLPGRGARAKRQDG